MVTTAARPIDETVEPAVARVFDTAGQVVGCAFLVGDGLLATCAHVVAMATGHPATAEHPPSDPILLDFPLLVAGVQPAGPARVVRWQPVAEDETGDIAMLELAAPAPTGARAARLATHGGGWRSPVRIFGFPQGRDAGRWVAGVLRGRQATGWIQLEAVDGPRVVGGFSGAPVWDDAAGAVVGMTVAAEQGDGTAFMIPIDTVLGHDQHLLAAVRPRSPYRGLEPFGPQDAAFFHGRARSVERLVELLRHRPVVMVAGASGSGKSSLVRAGLAPWLLRTGALLAAFRPVPGATPYELLSGALAEVPGGAEVAAAAGGNIALLAERIVQRLDSGAGGLVLLVDQFEELVAADPDAAKELFALVHSLTTAIAAPAGRPPPLRAVFTIRSAALDEVLSRDMTTVLEESTVYLGRMDRADLRAAIERPAEVAGLVSFEAGLVERVLDDAERATAQLPLVEFALTRLWEAAEHGVLTHQAYGSFGGVGGALVGWAEQVYTHRLSPQQRGDARRLLVRLARPGDDGSFQLSPARLDDLPAAQRAVAAELARQRLTVLRADAGQPEVVALAHEALTREWATLHGWLLADQEFRAWQEQLHDSLRQWRATNQDPGSLLRGAALARAVEQQRTRPTDLTPAEHAYITAGHDQERQGVRRRRLVVALITVLAVVASMAAVVAQVRNRAYLAELRTAAATQLARMSDRKGDRATALQLAQAAWAHDPHSSDAYGALLRQYLVHRDVTEVRPAPWGKPIGIFETTPDGAVSVVAEEDSTVTVWFGLFGPAPTHWRVPSPITELRTMTIDDSGRWLVLVDQRTGITLWDIPGRRGPLPLRDPEPADDPSPAQITTLAWTANGERLVLVLDADNEALGSSGQFVEVWEPAQRRRVEHRIARSAGGYREVDAVLPDGRAAWFSETEGKVTHNRLRDLATGQVRDEAPEGQVVQPGLVLDCDSTARRLTVRDAASGATRYTKDVPDCFTASSGELDATGRYVVYTSHEHASSSFGLVQFVELATGRSYRLQVAGTQGGTGDGTAVILPGAGGEPVVYGVGSGTIRRYRVPALTAQARLLASDDGASRYDTVLSADGRYLASTARPGLRLFEVTAQRLVAGGPGTPAGDLSWAGSPPAFSPDGRWLYAVSRNDELLVLSVPDLAVHRRIPLWAPPAAGTPSGVAWSTSIVPMAGDEVVVLHAGALSRLRATTAETLDAPLVLRSDPRQLRDVAQRSQAQARAGHPRQVVVTRYDGLELWDLDRRTSVASSVRPGQRMTEAVFDEAGRRAAIRYESSGSVDLWDYTTQARAVALTVPPGDKLFHLGADDRLFTDSLNDLHVFDLGEETTLGTVTPPGSMVQWSRSGDMLWGITRDGAFSFPLRPEQWFAELCRISDRPYRDTEGDDLPPGTDPGPPCRLHR